MAQMQLPFLCSLGGFDALDWAIKSWSGDYVVDAFNITWSDKWIIRHPHTTKQSHVDADPRFIFFDGNIMRSPNKEHPKALLAHTVVRLAPSCVNFAWRHDYILMGERLELGNKYSLAFSMNVYDEPGYSAGTYGVFEHGLRLSVVLPEGDFSKPNLAGAWTRMGNNPCKKLDHLPDKFLIDYNAKINALQQFVKKCQMLKESGGAIPYHDDDAEYAYLQEQMMAKA